MGAEAEIALPSMAEGTDYAKFRAKVRAFLREHQDHITVHKLRMNKPLTASDLTELERMLVESRVGAVEQIQQAAQESHGLGLFVRTLIGLDRGAAKEALAGFMKGRTLSANQIEFVNLIVDHLTEHGVMDAASPYGSPFTDLTPRGPDAIFSIEQLDELLGVFESVRASAMA